MDGGFVDYDIEAGLGQHDLVTVSDTPGLLQVDLRDVEISSVLAEVAPPGFDAGLVLHSETTAALTDFTLSYGKADVVDLARLVDIGEEYLSQGEDPDHKLLELTLGGEYDLIRFDTAADEKITSDLPVLKDFLGKTLGKTQFHKDLTTKYFNKASQLTFDAAEARFSFELKGQPSGGSFGKIEGGWPEFPVDQVVALPDATGGYVTSSTGTPLFGGSLDLDYWMQSLLLGHGGAAPDLLERELYLYRDSTGMKVADLADEIPDEAALRFTLDYDLLDLELFMSFVPEIETRFAPTGLLARVETDVGDIVSQELSFGEIGEIDISPFLAAGAEGGTLSFAVVGDRSASLGAALRYGLNVSAGKFHLEADFGDRFFGVPLGEIKADGIDLTFPSDGVTSGGELFDLDMFSHTQSGARVASGPVIPVSWGSQSLSFLGQDAIAVAEGTRFVTALTVLDSPVPDLAVTGGPDAALFDIRNGSELIFRAAPDFDAARDLDADNVYDVTVTASDGRGASASHAIAVTVLKQDETASVPVGTDQALPTGLAAVAGIAGSVLTATVRLDRPAPEAGTLAWRLVSRTAELDDVVGGQAGPVLLEGRAEIVVGDTVATIPIATRRDTGLDDELLVLTITAATGGVALPQNLSSHMTIRDTTPVGAQDGTGDSGEPARPRHSVREPVPRSRRGRP